MDSKIKSLEQKLTRLQAKRDLYRDELADVTESKAALEQRYLTGCKARIVLQEISQQTQKNIQHHISSLVTLALTAVEPYAPEFIMRFESRRNQTECDLLFSEGGKEQGPLDSSGYGLCDIVSFALRIAFWAIKKTVPVMILDEPFRQLSPNYHEKAGRMLKLISEKLGLQFIIVSHSNTINEAADKTFLVEKNTKTGISTVKEV